MTGRALTVHRLGRVEYEDGLRLQALFARARKEGKVGDVLLLLEHPPVLTLGRGASRTDVLAGPELLEARGVEVHETDRGGEVTYHGPGQIVGYPIVDLKPDRCDVHRYVRDLEEVLIRAVDAFGVRAGRIEGLTGIWVGDQKLAAIGVRISRWVTSHGFALNVNTDLSHFGLIVPCGITDKGVTSLERLLGHALPMDEVAETVARQFAALFSGELTYSK